MPAFPTGLRRSEEPVHLMDRATVLDRDNAEDFNEPAVGEVVHLPPPSPAHACEIEVLDKERYQTLYKKYHQQPEEGQKK